NMKTLSRPILLLLLIVLTQFQLTHLKAQTPSDKVEGTWNGVLVIGDAKLRLTLRISKTADGLSAVMDSLDQPNGGNLKIDSITFVDNVLRFDLKMLQIVYDGTLS